MAPDFRLIAIQPQPLNRWGGFFVAVVSNASATITVDAWKAIRRAVSSRALKAKSAREFLSRRLPIVNLC
jgi:hypothetical protein